MADKAKAMTPEEARLKEIAVLERLAVLYGEAARGAAVADPNGWANMPRADAIIEYLKTTKEPQTPKQIAFALEQVGCESNSEDPVASVLWALKKMKPKNPDLVSVGWGQWHLRSKYTKPQLEKLLAKRAGRGGRSSKDHAKRTSEGMRKRLERGEKLGAPVKMTEADLDIAHKMLFDGASVATVAEKFGVSKPLIYSHFRLERSNGTTVVVRRLREPTPITSEPKLRIVQ